MMRDQTEDTMDMKVLENMQMNVLNMETVHEYRSEHVWEQLRDADYSERIGAAKLLRTDGLLHVAAGLLVQG